MENILLCAVIIGIFVFGYFVMDRFGRFADANAQTRRKSGARQDRTAVTAADGQTHGKTVLNNVCTLSELLCDCDGYEFVVVEKETSGLIRYPEESGVAVKPDI